MTVKANASPVIDESRVGEVDCVVNLLDRDLEDLHGKTREVMLPGKYRSWMDDEIIRRYREEGEWKHVSIHSDSGGRLYMSTSRPRRWHENNDRVASLNRRMNAAITGAFAGFIVVFTAFGLFKFLESTIL